MPWSRTARGSAGLADGDDGYTYGVGPEQHGGGRYEIEVVIEKRDPPSWPLEDNPAPSRSSLGHTSSTATGFWHLLTDRFGR